MSKITLNNLPPKIEKWLKYRAEEKGNSIEQEVQNILELVKNNEEKNMTNLADRIQDLFVPLGGVELPDIPRDQIENPPNFEE